MGTSKGMQKEKKEINKGNKRIQRSRPDKRNWQPKLSRTTGFN
jgi:hypothetical protein